MSSKPVSRKKNVVGKTVTVTKGEKVETRGPVGRKKTLRDFFKGLFQGK